MKKKKRKRKEMKPLTSEEKKHVASKKPVIYAKMNLMLIIKNIKRLERILITLEHIQELLMLLAI